VCGAGGGGEKNTTLRKCVCVGNHYTFANIILVIIASRLCKCSYGPHKEYGSDTMAVGIFQIQFLIFSFLFLKCSPGISVTHSAVSLPNSRNGSRGHLSESPRQRESSLTSVQRFVLQRLRDRPPRYEDTNQIRLEKPPPYQEGVTNYEVSSVLFHVVYISGIQNILD
jgi:hypothetical protein